MFKGQKDKNDFPGDDVETIIGPSVKIEGDFNSSGNVMVAGFISGTFATTENLRVEEQAKIIADVKAGEAIVAGEIKGNVVVIGHLEILSTAKIEGNIKTGSISIQQGAKINGNCSMSGDGAIAEEIPSEPQPASTETTDATEPIDDQAKEQAAQDWLMAGEAGSEKDNTESN